MLANGTADLAIQRIARNQRDGFAEMIGANRSCACPGGGRAIRNGAAAVLGEIDTRFVVRAAGLSFFAGRNA